jgi:Flp pilus assembly protein TadD
LTPVQSATETIERRAARAGEAEAACFRALLAEDPACATLRTHLAASLLAAGDNAAAVIEASRAIAAQPCSVEPFLTRAAAQTAQGLHEAAAFDLRHAAGLAPDRPAILLALAACHIARNDLAQAEAVLREAVASAPGCAQAHANLASVLIRQGRNTQAQAPCRAALSLDPGLVGAHQNLSIILAQSDPAAARWHRDAAYRRQQIFVEPGLSAQRQVLVLAAADAANVPLRHLFNPERTTLVSWYVEYATPGQHDALPAHDIVFNAIGDADLAPALTPQLTKFLDRESSRLLNHPALVARTTRAHMPWLLGSVKHVLVPPVLRHTGGKAALAEAVAQLGYPVLLRPIGTHGGKGLIKAAGPRAVENWGDAPAYITRFIDFASPDGWYRKYRVIFIDGEPYPYHLAIGPRWLVHHCTTGMQNDPARRAEEQRFLADPESALGPNAMRALWEIAERLGLDYAGIDFSLLEDGRLLLFEANATMLVHPEDEACFAYRNTAVTAIQAAFEAMLVARINRPTNAE